MPLFVALSRKLWNATKSPKPGAASDCFVKIGDGDLEIWWEVTGTDYWADIGVLTIRLYESTDNSNWYWVDTFHYTDYPTMLAHNTYFNMSHVDYQGVTGRYYKAYVTIWAGPEDSGDARYIWTPVERAT